MTRGKPERPIDRDRKKLEGSDRRAENATAKAAFTANVDQENAGEAEQDPGRHGHETNPERRKQLSRIGLGGKAGRLPDQQGPYIDRGQAVINACSQGHNGLC